METKQSRLITLDEIRAAIKRAVEERGEDYVYPEEEKKENPIRHSMECQYRKADGTPSCLIGLAVYYINPDIVLPEFRGAWVALQEFADRDAIDYAQAAQTVQDEGGTWGKAYHRAEEWLANRTT